MNQNIKNLRIEFHILQSFAVTCLNRDDVGAPKSAIVGGVTRARISSQCWKRQVRLELQNFGVKLAVRTKKVYELFLQACLVLGAEPSAAQDCATELSKQLAGDALLFISDSEVTRLAEYAQARQFDVKQLQSKQMAKELAREAKKVFNPLFDALDIALFGRMVAKAPEMSVEAASSFSHAISTHQAYSELDFFTAQDDHSTDVGSAHMGTIEFNSATYYRYVSLDLGQLAQTLSGEMAQQDITLLQPAITSFIKALFSAIPQARQTTQAGSHPWEYARIFIRRGQRLQASFEKPVQRGEQQGYLANSIIHLKHYLDKKEKMAGSLFGKLGCYEWGEDENYSIDQLIADINQRLVDLI